MNTRKILSIIIVAILAAVTTFSSYTYLTPVLAQTSTEQAGDTTQEEPDTGGETGADTGGNTTGADTGAARQNYQEFNTCLTQAKGDEGFATEDEIRECFQPIYVGGEASQDEESDEGSQDEESDEGSQDDGLGDEDDNNAESGDSEN